MYNNQLIQNLSISILHTIVRQFVMKPTHFYPLPTTYSYSTNLSDHFDYHIAFLCYHVKSGSCWKGRSWSGDLISLPTPWLLSGDSPHSHLIWVTTRSYPLPHSNLIWLLDALGKCQSPFPTPRHTLYILTHSLHELFATLLGGSLNSGTLILLTLS